MRPEAADAIAGGRRPESMDNDEKLVWTFCTELLETTQVSDETFAAVTGRFGEQGVMDLTAALGYYSLVSMILNVYRVQLPAGEEPPLKPLG